MWRKKGLDQGFRENGTQVCLLCFFVISGVFQDMSPGCSFQNWEEKRNMGGGIQATISKFHLTSYPSVSLDIFVYISSFSPKGLNLTSFLLRTRYSW